MGSRILRKRSALDSASVSTPLIGQRGIEVGSLWIYARGETELRVLSRAEAAEFGEQEVQIFEATSYEYEVRGEGLNVEATLLINPSKITSRPNTGTILTGNHAGVLEFWVTDDHLQRAGVARIEVIPRKIGYRQSFRQMLADIATFSTQLLLQLTGATRFSFASEYRLDSESSLQRLVVILGLITSEEVCDAMDQVLGQTHNQLMEIECSSRLDRGARLRHSATRSLASGGNRCVLPEESRLRLLLSEKMIANPSLPRVIESIEYEVTRDTKENRFLKHVLSEIEAFLGRVESALLKKDEYGLILRREVIPARNQIEGWLANPLFLEVSDSAEVPTNSTVLQRKHGYREIYELWLAFESALLLEWDAGDQIFSGGARDTATLYEYWVFFVLLEVIADLTGGFSTESIVAQLFTERADGFSLSLKRGQLSACEASDFAWKGVRLKFKLMYNHTFSFEQGPGRKERLDYVSSLGRYGSWTRQMRPDYSLVIWDGEMTEEEAVIAHKYTVLHFDAKYSVDHLKELFGDAEESLDNIKQEEKNGRFKRGDLLKMHAYKDAIRQSRGAYVLYPGIGNTPTPPYQIWLQYHEIVPGVGAFCLRPGESKDSCKLVLQNFLSDVLDQASAGITKSISASAHPGSG